MEGEENDDDIWDEKSLKQLKRKHLNPTSSRGKSSKAKSKRLTKDVNEAHGSSDLQPSQRMKSDERRGSGNPEKAKQLKRKRVDSSSNRNELENEASKSTDQRKQPNSSVSNDKVTPQKVIMDGVCPKCQMPFSALIGQSPGWHVMECLETKYSYIGMAVQGVSYSKRCK